jgi:alcohol dehydrogenase class IV
MDRREFIGRNSYSEFAAYFETLRYERVFLVTGKESYRESGAKESMTGLLAGKRVTHFDGFSVNPQLTDVLDGITRLRDSGAEVVLGVGGGSALDVAKSIALLSRQRGDPGLYTTGEIPIERAAAPVIAVPTTAGTGSEATKFATVYVGADKHSLEHDSILPRVAVADPAFTLSLPPYHTATTGMDALSQAVESYWSVRSTPESKTYAAEAIELGMFSLRKAVHDPDDESRLNMMVAANRAGKAINISRTTACHALSYYLTSHFHVPHGHAVGLTLSKVLEYNSAVNENDINDATTVPFVQETMRRLSGLLGGQGVSDAARNIDALMEDIGLAGLVSQLGVDSGHIENMVRDAMGSNRMANNPRGFTQESLTSLLTSIFT